MGERELREKYGGKVDKAINRAIRAEFPEGNAALDELTRLSGPAFHSGQTDPSGNPTPEALAFQKHQTNVVDPLIERIRKKYSLAPAKAAKSKSAKSGRPPSARRKPPAR